MKGVSAGSGAGRHIQAATALFLLLACAPVRSQDPNGTGEEKPRGETRFSLSVADEFSEYTSARAPVPSRANLLLVQPSFSYRQGERWRVSTSLAGLVYQYGEARARARVKETYLAVSAGDWDFAAGKKIVRWSAGYAFTPTGVLDPPRDPADPADRLNLNEGREMALVNWVRGRHSLTAAWASAGLVQSHHSGMRETLAFRYNAMFAGFDASLILSRDRGGSDFLGVNFTRVLGDAVEIHGEFARRAGDRFIRIPGQAPLLLEGSLTTAYLFGGKYTHRTGIGTIFEVYSADGLLRIAPDLSKFVSLRGLTERRHYAFLRVGKSRLRDLPRWKEWDINGMVLAGLSDGGRLLILDFERRLGRRLSIYGRAVFPGGDRFRSEYGMMPYRSQLSAGLRLQF